MVGLIIIIVIASVLVASKYKLDEEEKEDKDESTEICNPQLSSQSTQYSKVEKQVLNLLQKDEDQKWNEDHHKTQFIHMCKICVSFILDLAASSHYSRVVEASCL